MANSKAALEPLAIGIDIGGTGTKFGIVDRVGNVLFSGGMSTKKHAQVETFIDDLYKHVKELIDKAGLNIEVGHVRILEAVRPSRYRKPPIKNKDKDCRLAANNIIPVFTSLQ